ncbi:unnamed protein product [Camellia sinensis]
MLLLLFLGCVPKFSFGGKSFQENACKEKKVAIQKNLATKARGRS